MSQVIEQRIATLLGNLGLLPFAVLALGTWLPLGVIPEKLVELSLVAWAAVILSFLGAVHWGLALLTPALTKPQAWNALGWGVVPALLGWLALLLAMAGLPMWLVYAFLIGDVILCRMMDAALLPQYGAVAPWYGALRTRLSVGAALALAVAFVSAL